MRTITANRKISQRISLRLCVLLTGVLALTPVGHAVPPIDPLLAPDYSFDLESCAVDGDIVDAGDILNLDFPDPNVVLSRAALGLLFEDDDLDALSADNALVDPEDTFVLLFSVGAQTVGLAPPDPNLIDLAVPYNVTDQAARGHAAGDQFMSTQLSTRLSGVIGVVDNNVLNRNNYDEGGTDFSAQPPTAAHEPRQDEFLDVVDATAWLPRGDDGVAEVYFSATASSPSLATLPCYGTPSGADIYFNENPPAYVPTALYASHQQLQLQEADDIDALIVFDTNESEEFDESDQVLFSLAPGSPSLSTIPGASAQGAAADVFTVTHGEAPALFAAAADLGLGDPQDDIDALDFVLCSDAVFCATQHGIRSPLGDLDRDGDVDLTDLATLLGNYDTAAGACYEDGDLDRDGDVDVSDLSKLLSVYGTSCV